MPPPSAPDPGDGVLVVLQAATARALFDALSAAVSVEREQRDGEPLTPREAEVLLCLSQGKGYGEIAAELYIELETVRTHARRVRRKLGVATSRELRGRRPPPGARERSAAEITSPPDHLPPAPRRG